VAGLPALSWRSLGQSDLPAVVELARECVSADGGQPFAASSGFLSGCYLSGAEARAGFGGGELICVSSLRRPEPGRPDDGRGVAVTTGLVHPAWRRRGIGGYAFDWARDLAGPGELLAETEALGDGAHALYLSRGLPQVLAEDVMQLAASAQPPAAHPPGGLTLSTWGQADPARFYAVYEAAFRERPGFPGWTQAEWAEWISADEDFRADWTLLATLGGADVAFIAGEATGWIAQLGVVPSARGHDIGARLVGEAVRRMRSAGESSITLNVNINNPQAAALYRRLGLARIGRRARYRTPADDEASPAAGRTGSPDSPSRT
jgi:mycothiol synthase